MRLVPFFILFLGCAPQAIPDPEPPYVVVDRDAAFEERTPCGGACSKLRALGCPEGMPRDGGRTCPETCREGIVDGLISTTWPACILEASKWSDLGTCSPPVRCRL